MPTGKVKFFDSDKGFGFVSSDEGGDIFVPASALPEGVTTLKGGQRIEFSVAEGRRGAQALAVHLLDPAPSVAASRTTPRSGQGRSPHGEPASREGENASPPPMPGGLRPPARPGGGAQGGRSHVESAAECRTPRGRD